MTIKVGINGMGRIGRMIVRSIYENYKGKIIIKHINNRSSSEICANLLKHDSIHGNFSSLVKSGGNYIKINKEKISYTQHSMINDIKWKKYGVDYVFECTGNFNSKDQLMPHIENGVKKVIVSAPCKMADKTIVFGVNHKTLTKNEHILYGSTSRLKSLNNCLNYISRNNLLTKYLLVHDVARPVLNLTDIKKIIKEIHKTVDGSTLGYPLTNAVKEVRNNNIYYNINKSNLWSTFTPQIFKMEKLYHSIKTCLGEKYDVDDDIEALLLNSLKCSMIISSPTNIKVTYKSDINYIKKLL